MGNTEVRPLYLENQDIGIVGVILRVPNKVRILYAPPHVNTALDKLVRRVMEKNWHHRPDGTHSKIKHGIRQFTVPGMPFSVETGKDSAATGKIFACELLKTMYTLGYDYMGCSDLARINDQGTLFFKKVSGERQPHQICCIAPGGYDKLILARHSPEVKKVVEDAIIDGWKSGISRQNAELIINEDIELFKISEWPWVNTEDESILAKQMLIKIIEKMSTIGWEYSGPICLKGKTDALFFTSIYPTEVRTVASISMNRKDRLRLIDFHNESVLNAVRLLLNKTYGEDTISTREYCGATEFKLPGEPFHCSGEEAIGTQMCMIKLLETLTFHGWIPLTGIDVAGRQHDKSIIAMTRTDHKLLPFACISLSDVNQVSLINFPSSEKESLALVIKASYGYGLSNEVQNGHMGCMQFHLNGNPWEDGNVYGIHGVAMMMHLIKKAESLGWKLTCSLDVSSKYINRDNAPDVKMDGHSLYFCKDNSEDLFRSSYTRFPEPDLAPSKRNEVEVHHQPGPTWILTEAPPSYREALKEVPSQ